MFTFQNINWNGGFALVSNYLTSVDFLLVGGGGSGGVNSNQGGGAGGMQANTASVSIGTIYTVTIGAGAPAVSSPSNGSIVGGTHGSNSIFSAWVTPSYGGGGAGLAGGVVGSGGGAITNNYTPGQGNPGGSSGPAGGGGAGAAGGNFSGSWPTSGTGGAGGAGRSSSLITANLATALSVGEVSVGNVYFAGGGGSSGDVRGVAGGAAGLGGGGAGVSGGGQNANSGSANSGGGGGGSSYGNGGNQGNSGAGGSGVAIIRLPAAYFASNTTGSPNLSIVGGYNIYTFKSSGTITF